jgi:hypothetical protein
MKVKGLFVPPAKLESFTSQLNLLGVLGAHSYKAEINLAIDRALALEVLTDIHKGKLQAQQPSPNLAC